MNLFEQILMYSGAVVAACSLLSPVLRKVGDSVMDAALKTASPHDDGPAKKTRNVLFAISDGLDVAADVVGMLSVKGKKGKR